MLWIDMINTLDWTFDHNFLKAWMFEKADKPNKETK